MAIDNRLQIFDEQGNPVDYDILASDVKFMPDGKDLPTKLAEMDAHQGDGTVKGVKMNNGSPIEPDGDGVVDLGTVITQHQDISGKVDKETGKSLMSADEHTKLEGIEAGAEKNIIKGIKANGASTTLPVDQNGVVELPPAGSTISPATAAPSMDGNTAAVGVSDKYAREDHVHPHDSSKANSSDLQNYATKNELTSGLSGKQDTLTFDTTPTTGHTTQVMSSDSIKTAIDQVTPTIDANGKWVIGGVTTTHDAHGPMGNISIEDANDMVALIVNDLTTGGQANFLSADMGKALLSVLLQIFGNLGEYAFPNGKPTLNFNTQISFPISYSQSDQHITYADGQGGTAPSTVELLGRLEIQLGTDNNLYVINESAVKVFVGGTEVSNAYDPTTDKIIIPEVYGNVVIIAEAWTYVGYGESDSPLVSMFDGKNRGDTAGEWVDVMDGTRKLILTGCTEQSDHVEFDGASSSAMAATTDVGIDANAMAGTIEGVISGINLSVGSYSYPLINRFYTGVNKLMMGFMRSTAGGTDRMVAFFSQKQDGEDTSTGSSFPKGWTVPATSIANKTAISLSDERAHANGSPLQRDAYAAYAQPLAIAKLAVFSRTKADGTTTYYAGSAYCIRVYNAKLSETQVLKNYKIDKKRFNLA